MAGIPNNKSSLQFIPAACGLLVLLAAVPVASQPITFSIAGDHPYEDDEIPEFQQHMELHNLYSPSEFLVHVGDIREGLGPCMQARYDTVAAALKTLAVPAFMIPGDNEWTDCSNPDSAWTYWENAFLDLELEFCSAFPVERQAIRRENFAFVRSGVLFVGINMPNGSADDEELRMDDNAAWVDYQLLDKGPQVRAAVVFGHAGRSGSRDRFFDQFRVSALTFGKPVLYAMGDEHQWEHDDPWLEPNIQRVIVEAGGSETPVQVTVTTDSVAVFEFLRDALNEATIPFNLGPCVEVGPHQIIDEAEMLFLAPQVSDDGVTGPGGLTVTWSQVGGVGTVVFADPNQAATTALFSAPDLYTLRLEVDDGEFVASDEVTVDVLGVGAPARITIDDVTIDEGNGTTRTARFTVTRGGAFGEWVGVSFATENGTAIAPGDFTAQAGTLAFAPFALTKTVVVEVVSDSEWEPDEIFFVNLSEPTNGANIAKPQGVGTIANDDILYHDLVVTADPPGWVTLDPPGGAHADGSTVTLTAEFPPGLALGAWSGALSGSANPAGLLMDGPKSVHATFVPNAAPVAAADSLWVDEDVVLSIGPPGLLGNDSDPDFDPLYAEAGADPLHGTLALGSDGSLTYTPDANFWGPDSFTYLATDGRGAYDSASVAITVNPVDDAPTGVADAYQTPEATTLFVGAPGVLANDSDVEGGPLTALPAAPPASGSLALNLDGSFTYVPSVALVGRDSFTYRVSDGVRTSDEIAVDIVVGGPEAFVFTPTDDSYTRSSNPDTDYGSAEELRVRGGAPSYNPYLKFAPSGLGEIVGATLRLYVTDSGEDGGTLFETSLDFAGTTIPWTENGLNSANAPPFVGPALGASGEVPRNVWVEWDVSSVVDAVGSVSFGLTSVEPHSVRYSSSEGSEPPQLVVHAFRGVQDVVTLPTSYDWGDLRIPGSGATTVEVRNDGTAHLTVSGTSLVGPHASDFAIVTGGGSYGLAPGEARLVEVSFQPPLPGVRTAALRLATDDPDELTVDVALIGHAIEPEIAAAPASQDWGDVRLGTAASRSVEIRNEGAADLVVSATTIEGPAASDFVIVTGGGSFTLVPGAAHVLELGFQTAVAGDRAAVLRVASDDRDENPLEVPLTARGVEPEIDIVPAGQDFGDVLVGTVASAVVEIRNGGFADLAVTTLSVEGANAGEFGFGAAAGSLTVAPGDTARVDVTFEPSGTGPKTASLRIVSDDADEGVVDVPLAGAGVVPDIGLDPEARDWGDLRVGATAAHSFDVRNDGGAALTVTATTLTGSDAAEFVLGAGGGAFVLAPGESRAVDVSFAPTRSGPAAAALGFASDDPDEPLVNIALAGTAIEPDIAFTETSRDWGNVRVSTVSSHTFEVRNDGTADLAVTATNLEGPDAAEFAIVTGGGAFTVAAGGAHAIEVSFSPPSSGPKSGTLSVTSDDLDEGTAEVSLTGTGIEPEITVGPSGHEHGDVRVGTVSTRTFDVLNEGTAVLVVSGVNIEGPDAGDFFVAEGGGSFEVPVGAEHTIDVSFLPTGTGARAAALRIESDDADEGSLPLSLSGTGVEPDIATDAARDWSEVRTGSTSSLAIEVQNVGTSELALGAATLEGPDAAEFTISAGGAGATIAAGETHAVVVGFQPVTPGAKAASLSLSSDDPDESVVSVALTGLAVEPDVDLDVSAHDWGDVRVATTSTHAFELRNDGTADLAVTSTTLEGADASDWLIVGDGENVSVPPGEALLVTLEFSPATAGPKSASLRFETDDPDEGSVVIALAGRGVEPQVAVTPGSHDWGEVRVAMTSERTVEVRNDGTADLTVGAPSVAGANAAEFTFAPAGGFVVAPGGVVSIDVTFQPDGTGVRGAVLRIPSDDADQGVVDVALAGTGVEADIEPDPGRDWGDVRVGTAVTSSVTIRNVGTFDLAVSATELEGTDATEFGIVAGGGTFVLAPGATRDLDLSFLPASPGPKSARIRVTSDDPDESSVEVVLAGNGISPEIVVTPLARDWGNVRVGTAVAAAFEVRNEGTAELAVEATEVRGPESVDFSVGGGGGGFSVAPGESREIEVTFAPTATEVRAATLHIASDDDDESAIDVSLAGTGVEPDIGTDPEHDWGDVRTGTAAAQPVEIRNDGTSDLTVIETSLEGTEAAEFAVTAGGGGFTLGAGETHTVELSFQPDTPGTKSATLRIASDDPDEGSVVIALAGRGVEPQVAVTPGSHDWGEVRVAMTSERTVEVRNDGTADLTVGAPSVAGANAAEFTLAPAGGFVVAPGGVVSIDVTFQPDGTGVRGAVLRIPSDDADQGVVDVALAGTGVEADIEPDPGRDWGDVRVGTAVTSSVTIRNVGTFDLAVSATELEGTDATEFGIVAGGGAFVLAPGATRDLDLSFLPASPGPKSARIRVTSDDPDESSVEVVLAGNGISPEIVVTPLARDWGNVRVGTAVAAAFEVRNEGTAELAVEATEVLGPESVDFSVGGGGGGFSVAPGESREIEVTFAPTATGVRAATLHIASDDDDESAIDVSLVGTGVEPDIGTDPEHDWGDVRTGTAAAQPVEIRNDGTSDLTVIETSLEGTEAAEFAVTAGGGGFTLGAGETHTVEISFEPDTPGTKSATLRIASDDPDEGSVVIALAGRGVEPDIATDSSGRDWGDVRVATGLPHGFVVSNEGTAELALSVAEIVGPEAADFTIVAGGEAGAIPPGGTRVIDVRFEPAAPGPRAATLRITSDDPDEATLELSLAGRGVEPEITVSPGANDWGEVRVGTSASLGFEIRNDGEADLIVGGADVEGVDAEEYEVVDGTGGFTIAPGETRQVAVRFAPTSVGAKVAVLRITSDDSDETAVLVALAGVGVEPDIGASTGQDWGDVRIGTTTGAELLVRNDGTGDLTVTATNLEGADAAEFAIVSGGGSFVVAAGGSHVIGLSVTPATGGAKSAVLRVTSDDPDEGIFDVPLTARAVEPIIEVSPPSRDFGEAGIGVAVTKLFSIHNAGTADLAVASTEIGGPGAAEFSIVSGGGELTAPPGVTHYVAVTFRPSAAGTSQASLTIASDDAARPVVEIPLTGTGVAPDISIGADHDFGDVRVGTTVSHAVDVANDGNTDLAVSAVELVGADAAAFTIVAGGGAFSLAPGLTRTIEVSWHAAVAGPRLASLRLTTNDPDESTVDVVLTGRAVEPEISVSPAAHDFGDLLVPGGPPESAGRASPASSAGLTEAPEIEIIVSNEGTSALLVSDATLEGPDAASFEIVVGAREAAIVPGETLGIVVRAVVGGLGPKSAVLRIANDDSDENPVEIPLAAKGVRFVAPVGEGGAPDDHGGSADDPPPPLADRSGPPETFGVSSVYPNPFAVATSIEFALPARSRVNIVVYDTAGRRVKKIETGTRVAGHHRAHWDGRDDFGRAVGSGIYFVRLESAGQAKIVKLILRR